MSTQQRFPDGKARFGVGLVLVCILVGLIVLQHALLARAAVQFLTAEGSPGWLQGYGITNLGIGCVGILISFAALVALLQFRRPLSVILALLAVLGVPLLDLGAGMALKWAYQLPAEPPLTGSQWDLYVASWAAIIAGSAYLLVSKSVAELYGTGTRKTIMERGPVLWSGIRGRSLD